MGFATTARHTLAAFSDAVDLLHEGDPAALHRTRVASRRLREILPILHLDPRRNRKLRRQLRKVTRVLGETRELDVLHALVTELRSAGRYPADALRRVGMTIERDRAESRRALKATLPPSKIKRMLGRLEAGVDRLSGEKTASSGDRRMHETEHARRWALDARVVHRASRAASAIEGAGMLYVPERLHDARIAVKRLRYAAELASDDSAVTRRRLAALRAAQDVLGQLHDYEVLIERVRCEQVTLTPPDLTAWRELKSLVNALENDCRRLHGAFVQHRSSLLATVRDLGAPATTAVTTAPARRRAAIS